MNTPDYSPNYSPDGLTYDDITELQREVTAELRREGHLPMAGPPPPPHRRVPTARHRTHPDHALAPLPNDTARSGAR